MIRTCRRLLLALSVLTVLLVAGCVTPAAPKVDTTYGVGGAAAFDAQAVGLGAFAPLPDSSVAMGGLSGLARVDASGRADSVFAANAASSDPVTAVDVDRSGRVLRAGIVQQSAEHPGSSELIVGRHLADGRP